MRNELSDALPVQPWRLDALSWGLTIFLIGAIPLVLVAAADRADVFSFRVRPPTDDFDRRVVFLQLAYVCTGSVALGGMCLSVLVFPSGAAVLLFWVAMVACMGSAIWRACDNAQREKAVPRRQTAEEILAARTTAQAQQNNSTTVVGPGLLAAAAHLLFIVVLAYAARTFGLRWRERFFAGTLIVMIATISFASLVQPRNPQGDASPFEVLATIRLIAVLLIAFCLMAQLILITGLAAHVRSLRTQVADGDQSS
jgi:hypothetical protein